MKEELDRFFQQRLGLAYLKVTRDFAIHERCGYLMANLDRLGPSGSAGLRLLDAGCGSGMVLRYLARRRDIASYTGIDLNAERLTPRYDNVRLPHRFANVDLDGHWRLDAGFDVAWSAEVLEHLLDDRGVLRKIAACVRPGGTIVLTMPSLAFVELASRSVPTMAIVSPTQDGGHVRLGYDAEDLRALAEAAGLELLRVDGISRADTVRARRRYEASNAVRFLDNLRLAFGGVGEAFALGAAFSGREDQFQSIGAVLRVAGQTP